MDISKTEKDIIQNLKDAGCGNKQIEEIITLYKKGKKEKIYEILEKHRTNILNKVHRNEEQISCVDYFIYQMKRGEGSEK